MNSSINDFFGYVKNKKVAFIGIGTSNLPLIKMFSDKGAKVIACDKKDFNSLGETELKPKSTVPNLFWAKIIFQILTQILFSEAREHRSIKMNLYLYAKTVSCLLLKWKFSLTCARAKLLQLQVRTEKPQPLQLYLNF